MALAEPKSLVLFDIDGTLLSIAARELNVFALALEQVYGSAGDHESYSFAGKTDHQIAFELLSSTGRTQGEIEAGLSEMRACYFELLEEMLAASSMEILPGVVELLDELERDTSVVLGLQTGNWETAAELKLTRFGLERYFRVGAFGDGHLDRQSLPAAARQRTRERLGHEVDLRRSVVVGDTVLDVACARAWDMPSVGVATGSASQEELREAGADLVVGDLGELDATRLLDLIPDRSS